MVVIGMIETRYAMTMVAKLFTDNCLIFKWVKDSEEGQKL